MYNKQTTGVPTPQANLAINKSRLKLYSKNSQVPTYYLSKGQEFQIELFNPTKDTIMAKIFLNGKPIAQGGLVLRPAERVFLDRYIDVAKKFKFDTYEVANTSESRAAIEDNGDFKVEFYKEQSYRPHLTVNPSWTNHTYGGPDYGSITTLTSNCSDYTNTSNFYCDGSSIGGSGLGLTGNADIKSTLSTTTVSNNVSSEVTANLACMDSLSLDFPPVERSVSKPLPKTKAKLKRKRSLSKSIETGRVAEGSNSSQELDTVSMNWETWAFHTIEYKMIPTSQKVNTIQEVSANKYCHNCGSKNKPTFKFCPSCGSKS